MSLTDFDGCTPQQFAAIFEAWQEREERRRRDGWEQSRFVVCGVLQPYSKKVIAPEDVCVFSWEREIAGQARNDGDGGRDEIAGQTRDDGEDERERAKKIRALWCKNDKI